MISYTKRYLNIVSFIITILIYIFFNKSSFILNHIDLNSHFISNMLKKSVVKVELNSSSINQETKEEHIKNQNNQSTASTEEANWKIII